MATNRISEVIEHLRRTVLLRDGAGMTDGQLLECFVSKRDKAVLGVLVRRHGPMVWGVCRRLLDADHDAEDAFQATFLVLVRKAASVVPREMVGNWLYGVACQTARKARATSTRRKMREKQVAEMPEAAVLAQDVLRDLDPLLDEELSRLPDKYRVAIVLCSLEGKTRKEAARELGLPEGTLSGRLTRGRALLAKRLARVGLTISGGALEVALSHNAASACVPASLVSSTIKAATLLAAGRAVTTGVLSAKAAGLSDFVLKIMLSTKLKSATAALLAVGVLAAGVGTAGLIHETQNAQQARAQVAHARASGASNVAPKEDQMPACDLGNEKLNEDCKPHAHEPADPLQGSFVLKWNTEPMAARPKDKQTPIAIEFVGMTIEDPPPRQAGLRVAKGTLKMSGMEFPIAIEFVLEKEKQGDCGPDHH